MLFVAVSFDLLTSSAGNYQPVFPTDKKNSCCVVKETYPQMQTSEIPSGVWNSILRLTPVKAVSVLLIVVAGWE